MPALDLAKTLDIPQLPAFLSRVDKRLQATAKIAGGTLSKPLLQTVRAKSKRLRPALLMASAIGSSNNEKLILGGSAIELLHLGSLVHDDIIDNSASRWGQPTIGFSSGPANAILAGDYLLAQAGALAARISAEAAELIAETISDLARGESMELAEAYNQKRSVDSYIECVGLKTGALISAACRLGGLCAGLKAAEIKALGIYGKNLGISFQIIDDLLDVLSTDTLLGKPVGTDASQGTYTLPVIYSLKGSGATDIKTLLKVKNANQDKLVRLLIADHSINRSLSLAKEYNNSAAVALGIFETKTVDGLANLPTAFLEWSLLNLVKPAHYSSVADSL